MICKTAIGELELGNDDIFIFPHGIPGFENLTKWAIRDSGETGLNWLLSLERAEIAFVIWQVQDYIEDYNVQGFSLTDQHKVYSILTMRNQGDNLKVTANLLAPVIIDTQAKRGIQYVMTDTEYSARTPLYTREEK